MPKTNKNGIYWAHGETIEGVQIPKHWKDVTENGRTFARVGNQHVIHFFGKGKRPQPCGNTSACFYCRDGNPRIYRYRTVAILEGQPLFVDMDAGMSRALAEIQQKFEEQGFTVSELQEKVYTIRRGEKGDRPMYVILCTGNKPLPEAVNVVFDKNTDSQGEVLTPQQGGFVTGAPQKDLLKNKQKKIENDNSLLDDLDEPNPPALALTAEETEFLKGFEAKIKEKLTENPEWDVVSALKTALKRKGWERTRIDIAVDSFDDQGNLVARTV
jgi:hypothetical protein